MHSRTGTEERKGGEEVGTMCAKDVFEKVVVNQSWRMGQLQEVAVLCNHQPFLSVFSEVSLGHATQLSVTDISYLW